MPKELRYKIIYNNQMYQSNFINGLETIPKNNNDDLYNIIDPTNGQLIKKVVLDDIESMNLAIKNSVSTYKSWNKMAMHKRIQLLIKWYSWIEQNKEKFIKVISQENGKPESDAKGEFQRGLEVLQYAISLQPLSLGKTGQVNSSITVSSVKESLGVVTAICPFNFPFMIPMWSIPIAIVLGNVIIVKPSEKVPGSMALLAKGAVESGIPDGVINVIQGGQKIVTGLIENKDIKAISFVGSTFIGKKIYDLATKNYKKVQCNMGAKNHVVITQTADVDSAVNGIVGAAFGGCGQRCMALSVAIIVGKNDNFYNKLIEKTKQVNIEKDMGPLNTREAKERINKYLNESVGNGSEIILDRSDEIKNDGFYMGPVIVKTDIDSSIYQNELFGPVLSVIYCETIEEAIQLINKNEYGNGTAIYSNLLDEITMFENEIEVGQIGINIPIPVPPPYFSWSSSKNSFIGNNYVYGPQSIDFYTKTKTIMKRSEIKKQDSLSMPTN
jgi:malonate-semialdehyde dehydrogenase (acetylating) / methylmalonate-semialdehyde dehydrogenase